MNAPPFHGVHNQNVASDNSHVDQQIGVNFGETTFHYETTYNYQHGDPPEKKYRVAINFLEGGLPREAEKLLEELVDGGHATSELTYYYALAVLSDRSLNEVNERVFSSFGKACKTAAAYPIDTWRAALEVVRQLMSGVWRQESGGLLDSGSMTSVVSRFGALPPQRQSEITRHLAMILGGAIQDHLDAMETRRVMTERMDNDRILRAWKFFQAVPAPPRGLEPTPLPPTTETTTRTVVGGAAAFIGLLAFLSGLDTVENWFALPFLVASGYLIVKHGVDIEVRKAELRRKDIEHNFPNQPPVSPGHWVTTSFVKEIHDRMDARFREARAHVAGSWERDTRGVREYLKWRFVTLYGNAQVTPAAVDWLMRWHADQVGAAWRAGTLFQYRAKFVPSQGTTMMFRAGLGIGAVGLVVLIVGGAFGTAVLLGVGEYFLTMGVIAWLAPRRELDAARADNQQLLALEQQAHSDWVQKLKDRPTDAEMARWLDLDKTYLKTAALQACGLTNRDLVAHVVLTERAPKSLRARVMKGPPRYSAYVVLVFLLTESGVREVEVDLDFLTGAVHDERRTAFRYDALGSAKVTELGVRISNDRYVFSDGGAPVEIASLRSRVFRLSLIGGEEISVVVENFSGLTDMNVEDESQLLRIALHTSGVAGALTILEAVAAEGRDWISREQERRRRRSEDWQGSVSKQDLGDFGFSALLSDSEQSDAAPE